MMPQNNRNQLDELDMAILQELTEDGRKSFTDIARNLDVAANTVRNRVNRMVEEGTLTFLIRVNSAHVGLHAYGSIFIDVQPTNLIDAIANEIASYPETSFLAIMAGEHDLWVDVMCRDNEHLMELITERIQKIEGVVNTKTQIILKVHSWGQPAINVPERTDSTEGSNGTSSSQSTLQRGR